MEGKKIVFGVVLMCMAGLSLTLYLLDAQHLQHGFVGRFRNIMFEILGLNWSSDKNEFPFNQDTKSHALSPNLSSCHDSYGRSGLLVNCCPPPDVSLEPYTDFRFPDSSLPLKIRRPAHSVDSIYITKYNKAISIMKSLPYSDPRNFMRQANLHCIFCTGAYNELNADSPLDIHKSWLFFPWHRMVLYFHERILASLIEDETFALPYWAWDTPQGSTIPKYYLNSSFYDPERDISHLSPSPVDLNFYGEERNLIAKDQIDMNMALMYNQMVSGAKKTELFMGCSYKAGQGGNCHSKGTVETAPHNTVHTWVGSNLNVGRENMGKFYSAARDPIFYAHHSNIDRLWEVRRKLTKKEMEISDPDWLESHFFFYDENSKLIKIKVRDVLNITNLGYEFQETPLPWLNARPKPSMPPKLARYRLRKMERYKSSGKEFISTNFWPNGKALDTTITTKVNRPKNQLTKTQKEEEEVLVVHGISLDENLTIKFDVFVNLVDKKLAGPQIREFAGTFVHVPSGVTRSNGIDRKPVSKKTNLKLGISELLEDLEADGDENIWVTLIPRSKSCINTKVDGIRIEYIN